MILSASFGSFPRPDFLREYQIKRYGKQKRVDDAMREGDIEVLKRGVRAVVEDQTGLDIITDGQLIWDDFLASVATDFDGVEMGGLIRFYDNNAYYRKPIIRGEIRSRGGWIREQVKILREVNPGMAIKVVIPGPYTLYDLSEDKYYKDKAEGIAAMASALRDEIRGVEADYVQIDEPSLSYNMDKDLFFSVKEDIERLVVEGKKGGRRSILATYFGDLNSCIDELSEIRADYIGVDAVSFDNYEVLAQSGLKNVQLGLVDARNVKMEEEAEVIKRIEGLGSNNIIISTNCGMEFIPREYALKKVDLLSTIANRMGESK